MDLFSQGFVEILAAEQTPDNPNWFQGTADAVRQAARHFVRHDADYYLILAGDHLYRMDYSELVDAHIDRHADITIAAQPVTIEDAPAMGIFRFDRDGPDRRVRGEAQAERLREIGQSIPPGSTLAGHTPDKPFVASMGVYVFSRDVLLDMLAARHRQGLRPRGDPGRARPVPRQRVSVPRLLGRRRNGRRRSTTRTSCSRSPTRRSSSTTRTGRSTRTRAFCPARGSATAPSATAIIAEGCYLDRCTIEDSIVGIRTQRPGGRVDPPIGAARRRLLRGRRRRAGARRRAAARHRPRRRARSRDRRQERAHRRRRPARQRAAASQHADGDGYYIRNGIIVVPKDGTIRPGTVV